MDHWLPSMYQSISVFQYIYSVCIFWVNNNKLILTSYHCIYFKFKAKNTNAYYAKAVTIFVQFNEDHVKESIYLLRLLMTLNVSDSNVHHAYQILFGFSHLLQIHFGMIPRSIHKFSPEAQDVLRTVNVQCLIYSRRLSFLSLCYLEGRNYTHTSTHTRFCCRHWHLKVHDRLVYVI